MPHSTLEGRKKFADLPTQRQRETVRIDVALRLAWISSGFGNGGNPCPGLVACDPLVGLTSPAGESMLVTWLFYGRGWVAAYFAEEIDDTGSGFLSRQML